MLKLKQHTVLAIVNITSQSQPEVKKSDECGCYGMTSQSCKRAIVIVDIIRFAVSPQERVEITFIGLCTNSRGGSLFLLWVGIAILTCQEVVFHIILTRAGTDQVILPSPSRAMEAFEIHRVELSDSSREWFLLNSSICGVHPSRFMSRNPLVAKFPSEFATIKVEDIKNGGHLDRRSGKGDKLAVATVFGVVCAILRKNFKEAEGESYSWLVDAINSLKIGENRQLMTEASSRPAFSEHQDVNLPDIQRIQAENLKLKADFELALSQLESLRAEVEKLTSSETKQQSEVPGPVLVPDLQDVWTLIRDVREKYQVPLASAIADQVHHTEVAKMLGDLAELLVTKSGPKEAFEVMFGDSAPLFFQSLRVPDWTLLYFKLQSRIPDQGWQTLLSLTKLGRTGVS